MKVGIVLLSLTLLLSIGMGATADSATSVQRTGPVAVGELAPDFTLGDQDGNKVTLSDARGKSPVVLVFYRGYW